MKRTPEEAWTRSDQRADIIRTGVNNGVVTKADLTELETH